MSRTRGKELRVGLLLLAAAGVFTWLALQIGAMQGLGDTVTVTVEFGDAAGLVRDSTVKVAGVEVGKVKSFDVQFDKAVATLVLQSSAQLRKDVRAEVRARSLLGEKYVALLPRSRDAELLQDGDRLIQAADPVEIDQLVQALGPLLAEVEPQDVARMVKSLGDLLDVGSAEAPALLADVQEVLAGAKVAAELGPELRRDVPRLLGELRAATSDLRGIVRKADTLLGRADPIVDDVAAAAKKAPDLVDHADAAITQVEPGLDDLRKALEQSDELVARLDGILAGFEGFDREELRRLLRDEGVLVRLKPSKPGQGGAP